MMKLAVSLLKYTYNMFYGHINWENRGEFELFSTNLMTLQRVYRNSLSIVLHRLPLYPAAH